MTEPLATTSGEPAISFGPFRLVAAQRLLLEGDKPVRLGSRAFDILTALVERAGEVVGKVELIARAWPATYVEEANLKIQVSALRRALGDGQGDNRYVATVVGRGYNFVAPIRKEEPSRAAPSPTIAPAAPHNLPFATIRMIGREEIAATLVTQLSRQRLVTVVGPGGIGKTTVALDVAERMIGAYEHGVWLVDLAPLRDPGLVPSAVATVLGLEIRTEDPLPGLVAALADRRVLLLLDSCEHVVAAAAGLAAAIHSGTPGVTVLATSREPLGLPGERVYSLGPLSSPEPSPGLTAPEAAAFPAVQLFVERVSAIVEDFALTDANAPLVVAICRRLDGLPLAIEFAAPRVEALGVEGLAARLDDNLRLLSGARRRAAVPRHRTMQAVIDWSYGLLSEDEQRFFRALGMLAGGFTAEAAAVVAMDATTTRADAMGRLADLVAKSLIVADVSGTRPRFRLLDTTRAYALEKLDSSAERQAIARRHAEYYRDLFERVEREVPARPPGEWLADYALEIDNLRASLTWAFGPEGNAAAAVRLASASAPLWLEISLLSECRGWMEAAIARLDDAAAVGTRQEMVLQTALGLTHMYTRGTTSRARAVLTRACELAESYQSIDYQLRILAGLALFCLRFEDFRGALALARQAEAIATGNEDPVAIATMDCIISLTVFFLGEYAEACTYARRARDGITSVVRRAQIVRSGMDYSILARCIEAQVLWLRGSVDQATQVARDVLADAWAGGHPASLCQAIAWCGCRIPLRLGDLEAVEQSIAQLKDIAERNGLGSYYAMALGFEGQLRAGQGDAAAGVRLLHAGLDGLRNAEYENIYTAFLGVLADLLVVAGNVTEGLATVGEALRRIESKHALWLMPEALRIEGEAMLLSDEVDTAVVEKRFARSLDVARQQGALWWELRTATSFARLLRDHGHSEDAVAVLHPVYNRFTEGFGTTALVAAKQLLDQLGTPDHD
jgi:predicted ATPase/DNA-binding winged helix-turn-helix (wHTH) protein